MNNNFRSLRGLMFSFVAASLFCAGPSTVSAITVDNSFDTNLTGSGWTNNNTNYRTWDDFTITSATTFTAASFQSYVQFTSGTANYSFDIVFDAGGALGASAYSTSLAFGSVSRTAYTGPVLSGGAPFAFEHSFSLPSITLGAGTYWVSLTSTDNLFGSASSSGNALIQQSVPGGIEYIRSNDALAFQLTDSSAVPDTASTLALLGSAILGLTALRRRFAA